MRASKWGVIRINRAPDRNVCILVAASLLVGCGSGSDFFQARNPFQDDLRGVRAARAKQKVAKKERKESETRAVEAQGEALTVKAERGEGIDTGTVRRSSTGDICYLCNGKGYRMKHMGSGSADYYRCEHCGGTGRE